MKIFGIRPGLTLCLLAVLASCGKEKATDSHRDYVENALGLKLDMVYVEGGSFAMGATEEQGEDALDNEKPVRTVRLDSYYIGRFEITQGQWEKVMGSTVRDQWAVADIDFGISEEGDAFPMYYITWEEAVAFCEKLSELTGRHYVLPTEAQWEYAARGGRKAQPTKYSGSDILDEVGWYYTENTKRLQLVGGKSSNELGIYDMSGNVWEYCADYYDMYDPSQTDNPTGAETSPCRVSRGGSWADVASHCRVSYRATPLPNFRLLNLGFRVAMIP
ncbi:MAG: formylglycine-generating enzyme family protein [Bacteroidales bacterium]|nr:formylglycine-generating enzyme family protein [Bacteroidales bacterium]MDE7073101.1 formylglycine-generating enzyme family protein [Bacteroidales bacterium]